MAGVKRRELPRSEWRATVAKSDRKREAKLRLAGIPGMPIDRGSIGRGYMTAIALETGRPSHVKVATASLIGTAIEWYDFFLYGTAAALIFNKLFFPTFDPMVGTLLAFATYAVGFVARPLGGLVFGHFGDTIGRKTMLYLTLLIMGVATAVIGFLPTYDTLGIWASMLLIVCRLLQGFGLGGEWGGAVLMAVEHAPEDKKGFFGSWRSWVRRSVSCWARSSSRSSPPS
jgi:MFS family permease